jgi:hypothetical protein
MTKKQATYTWSGARIPVKPDVAAAELDRIRKAGQLSAGAVVEAARPEDAPLHPAFQWDDEAAAEEYRLIQARRVIRALHVVQPGREPRTVYVHVERPAGEGDYTPLNLIVNTPDRFMVALAEAERSLASAETRVSELKEVASGKGDEFLARLVIAAEAIRTARTALAS